MAYEDYKQGEPIPYSFDLTDAVGVIDFNEVMVEVGRNDKTYLKYKYPATTGYGTITKNGNIYSFTVTSAQSKALLNQYDLELTLLKDGVEVAKNEENVELFNIKAEIK